ncbi:hypothetical protein ACLQ8T_06105 [Glutamicibacter sp. FR1]|uniref:hypothetical protein n=1 Tax=Glutamicibacter sp. FR1 TaxID=3393744 RepID=UPI0039B0AE0F
MTDQTRETDTLEFEMTATANSGIQVPMSITIEYPKDHGFYAVKALELLPAQVNQFYQQMIDRSDMSTLHALMNLQKEDGGDDE